MPDYEETHRWTGQKLVGDDGSKLGSIDDVIVDTSTGKPAFALVKVGWVGSKTTLVPVHAARAEDGKVRVAFTKDQVRQAPKVADVDKLTRADAQNLFAHYDLDPRGDER